MLCILRDWKGIVYQKLFPQIQTLNSDKLFFQLYPLKTAFDELELTSRKNVVSQQDDARLHVSSRENATEILTDWLGCRIHQTFHIQITIISFPAKFC